MCVGSPTGGSSHNCSAARILDDWQLRRDLAETSMNVFLPARLSLVCSTDARTFQESRLLSVSRTVSTWPRPIILGLMLGLVAAVGWVDYAAGLEFSVSLLYFLPIIIGTWIAGRSMGY